jgi:dienelactone hydrolase
MKAVTQDYVLLIGLVLLGLTFGSERNAHAQDRTGGGSDKEMRDQLQRLENKLDSRMHQLDYISKQLDDLMWYQRVGDVAEIQRVRYTGPPVYTASPKAQDAGNEIILAQYVFIPRNLDRNIKSPLMVITHGGIHANLSADWYATMVRELVEQGYVVIGPEYRGSTGFGEPFYHQLDYGGKEIEDVFLGSRWALANYPFLDPSRVGIFGWSHGGLITLLNIFQHPEGYKAAWLFAPVSNMAMRAGTKVRGGRGWTTKEGYGAPSSIGAEAFDDLREYVKRSPVYNADKLQTPLLIYGASNDSDVHGFEVQQLIDAFKVRNKPIEYKMYPDPPGEHFFLFIDTPLARQARLEGYRFLARLLNPPRPPK